MKKEFYPDEKFAAKERRSKHLTGIVISIALGAMAGVWLSEKFGLEDYWIVFAIFFVFLLLFIYVKFLISKQLQKIVVEENSLSIYFKDEEPQTYNYQDVEIVLYLTVKYGIKIIGRNLKLNSLDENGRQLLDIDLDSYFPIVEINSILNSLGEWTSITEKRSTNGGS